MPSHKHAAWLADGSSTLYRKVAFVLTNGGQVAHVMHEMSARTKFFNLAKFLNINGLTVVCHPTLAISILRIIAKI